MRREGRKARSSPNSASRDDAAATAEGHEVSAIPAAKAVARGEARDPWDPIRQRVDEVTRSPQGCGQVVITVQDGKVVQVDKFEKFRLDR